jgi:hypothetical protein
MGTDRNADVQGNMKQLALVISQKYYWTDETAS